MFRLRAFVLAGLVVLVTGCTRATFGFRPSLTSQVPDSTVVRFRVQSGEPLVTGRSLDWQTGTQRVVTAAGDTIVVPEAAKLDVRLKQKKTHASLGGVLGLAVGWGIGLAKCPPPQECSPSLLPALTGGAGAFIGSRFSAAEWVRVRRSPVAPDSQTTRFRRDSGGNIDREDARTRRRAPTLD